MKSILTAVALTLSFSVHAEPNWVKVDQRPGPWLGYSGDVSHLHYSPYGIYYDTKSLVIKGSIRKVWWKQYAEADNGEVIDVMYRSTINCDDHTYKMDQKLRREQEYRSYEDHPLDVTTTFDDFNPSDEIENVYETVCGK